MYQALDTGIKILIVEQLSVKQIPTKQTLQEMGFLACHEAEDSNTALSLLQADDFDLLLIDWDMPECSAIELLRTIRANNALASIPVMMCTGDARREKLIEAAGAGLNGYIVKPCSAQVLREKIDNVCSEQEAEII